MDLLQSVEAAEDVLRVPRKLLGSTEGAARSAAEDVAKDLRENSEIADELKQVIQLWGAKQRGIAIIDEVDLVLHPLRSELNFPIGEKSALDLSPRRWQLVMHLLDGIFYSSLGRVSVEGLRLTSKAHQTLRAIAAVIKDGVKEYVPVL